MRAKSNYLVKTVSAATTAYPGLDPNNPMAETLTSLSLSDPGKKTSTDVTNIHLGVGKVQMDVRGWKVLPGKSK